MSTEFHGIIPLALVSLSLLQISLVNVESSNANAALTLNAYMFIINSISSG